MDPQQLEQLKNQASERYLAGDYEAALAGWQQVLALRPDDAKALEGVRMCQLMTGGDPAAATGVAPAAPAPPAEITSGSAALEDARPAAAAPTVDLEIDLDLPMEPAPEAAPPAPQPASAPQAPPVELDLDLDLDPAAPATAQPEAPAAPTAPAAPSPAAPEGPALESEIDSHLSFLGGQEAAEPPAPAPPRPPSLSAVATDEEMTVEPQSGAFEPVPESAAAPELPDPLRQGEGIDFGNDPVETLKLAGDVPKDEPKRGLDGLNAMELEPESEPEAVVPPDPATAMPAADPAAAAEPLDLSLEIDEAALAAEPAAPEGPVAPPGADGPDPAAAELQQRVNELMEQARAAHAAGDTDTAAGILSRVFILDEENPAALELQREMSLAPEEVTGEQIEDWLNEATQLLGRGELVAAREKFEQVLVAQPGHGEAVHGLEQIEAAESGALPDDPAPTPPPELQDPALEGQAHIPSAMEEGTEAVALAAPPESVAGPGTQAEIEALDAAAEAPTTTAAARPGSKLPKLLAAVLVLGALGGAAWWAVPRYLNKEPAASEPVAAAPTRPTPAAAAADDSGSSDVVAATTATPLPAAPSGADELEHTMQQARSAYDSGDYEAAVLAYSRALELDPQNPEARDGLDSAGELYRTVQKQREQLRTARHAFEDGDYASALRLFYRLPETVEPELVQRYIVAGWYNMGLNSLKGGNCAEAVEHFDEALTVRPDDRPTLEARQYAAHYQVTPRDSDFYRSVEAMPFRTVE